MKTISMIFLVVWITAGCGLLKAKPAQDSGFLKEPKQLQENEKFPFNAWWSKAGAKKSTGGRLFVMPVNLDYLKKTEDWSHIKLLSDEEVLKEAKQLGGYFRERLIEEFNEQEQQAFQVVDSKEQSDGILEVAIVELVPTDTARSSVGTVLGMLIPGGGLVSVYSSGVIAIEGRFIETKTGEVMAKFKDRESGKIAPLDFAGLTAFRYSEVAIEDWAEQIVEILVTPEGAEVSDSSPFTLSPW